MKRRRFKPIPVDLGDRLAEQAKRFRQEANVAAPGPEKDRLTRIARQAETGSKMSEWLKSTGLQPPK